MRTKTKNTDKCNKKNATTTIMSGEGKGIPSPLQLLPLPTLHHQAHSHHHAPLVVSNSYLGIVWSQMMRSKKVRAKGFDRQILIKQSA